MAFSAELLRDEATLELGAKALAETQRAKVRKDFMFTGFGSGEECPCDEDRRRAKTKLQPEQSVTLNRMLHIIIRR